MKQQKDMSGILFKNDRKEKDSHPDYKGSITVDGEEYWLSAWIKRGERGTFMSLAVKPKEARPPVKKPPVSDMADMADDIPF